MSLAGIKPLAPGFARCEIRPQVADLDLLELTANTVRGPIEFSSRGKLGSRNLTLSLPQGCDGELVVDKREALMLKSITTPGVPNGLARYQLPAGKMTCVHIIYT
jgi:hypothetical protein